MHYLRWVCWSDFSYLSDMAGPGSDIIETVANSKEVADLGHAHLIKALMAYLNDLIVREPDKLISLLYRMDVNELTLKEQLSSHPLENAAAIIARLIIERQVQKIEARKRFSTGEYDSDEERW